VAFKFLHCLVEQFQSELTVVIGDGRIVGDSICDDVHLRVKINPVEVRINAYLPTLVKVGTSDSRWQVNKIAWRLGFHLLSNLINMNFISI